MSRARCYAAYADAAGNKLSGTSVYVYNPGTTTPITETIYDSFTAGGALANPLTTDANGGVLFYLAVPKRVDLQFRLAGYADFTLRDVPVTPDAADILLLATGGTLGAGAALDLSAMGATTFKPPASAGAAPTTEGALAYDSTAKAVVFGDGTIHHHVATLDAGSISAAALAAEAWTDFTPSLGQGGAVTIDVWFARYKKFGRLATVQMNLHATGAAAGAGNIYIYNLPAAITPLNTTVPVGVFYYSDVSVGPYVGAVLSSAGAALTFQRDGQTNLLGISPAFLIAATDLLSMTLSYEIAP